MGKISVTSSPSALPGSCFNCGSGNREWYVDFDLFLDFHGRLYLCNLCVIECSGHAGYVEPDEKVHLLEQRLMSAMREKAELREKLDNVSRIVSGIEPRFSSSDGNHSVDLPDVPEPAEDADGLHEDGALQLHLGAGTSDEPSHEQGLADVFSFAKHPDK